MNSHWATAAITDFTQPGVFNGQQYDAVQKNIRGNHLASVEEGRMGPDVAVLDHACITFDSKDFVMAAKPKKTPTKKEAVRATGQDELKDDNMEEEETSEMDGEMTMQEVMTVMEKVIPMYQKMKEMMGEGVVEVEEPGEMMVEDEEYGEVEVEVDDKGMDQEEMSSGMDSKRLARLEKEIRLLKKKPAAMDSKQFMRSISQRDNLANRLSTHVGTFDHSEKTVEEVAAYGIEKLGIPCTEGSEVPAIEAWLHNRPAPQTIRHQSYAADSANNSVADLFKRA